MPNVKFYDKDGDEKALRAQDRIRQAIGMVPQTYQAMGRSGDYLDAILRLERAAGNNLAETTRQLIMVAVSAANGCGYCLHAHRAMALEAGADERDVTGALEIAAMMSAYNTFNKALDLTHDVTPESMNGAGART